MTIWKDIPEDIEQLRSGNDTLNFLVQEGNIFVMDNHLAAGWCWLHHLSSNNQYGFCHIDQHDDLVNDGVFVQELKNHEITLDEYLSLSHQPKGEFLPRIKKVLWDNYIMRVKHINPHWFSKEVFACHSFVSGEKSSIHNEQKFDEEFDFVENRWKKVPIHPNNLACYDICFSMTDYLLNDIKWIVNLDIDFFFKRGICVFSDEYIIEVAKQIQSIMDRIAVLTIAISPECCGGWEKGKRVYNIIADILDIECRL